MAYFNNRDHRQPEEDYQPVFQQQAEDDGMNDDYLDDGIYDTFDDDDDAADDYFDEEDQQLDRQGKWRVLAGLGDFLGVLAGTVVILVLIALLVSLIHWVQSDISQSFTLWQTKM